MSWGRLLLMAIIPLLISLYTVNFGRWMLRKDNRFGGVCTIGLGIVAFVVPLLVYITKQQ